MKKLSNCFSVYFLFDNMQLRVYTVVLLFSRWSNFRVFRDTANRGKQDKY